MERIHLHNYESWFLDYAEGRLSAAEQADVEAFVHAYPHLRQEFESMAEWIMLTPESVSHPQPETLKVNILPVGEIHADNYTEYFIAAMEGDLTVQQQEQLDTFLHSNPLLQREARWVNQTRLQPDTRIVFPYPSRLRRKPLIPLYYRFAAGIAAAILIGLGFWRWTAGSAVPSHPTEVQLAISTGFHLPVRDMHPVNSEPNNTPANLPLADKNSSAPPHRQKVEERREPLALVSFTGETPVPVEMQDKTNDGYRKPDNVWLTYASLSDTKGSSRDDLRKPDAPLLGNVWSRQRQRQTMVSGNDLVDLGTAALSDMTRKKWVLKIDRDENGRTRNVRFSSPILNFRTN